MGQTKKISKSKQKQIKTSAKRRRYEKKKSHQHIRVDKGRKRRAEDISASKFTHERDLYDYKESVAVEELDIDQLLAGEFMQDSPVVSSAEEDNNNDDAAMDEEEDEELDDGLSMEEQIAKLKESDPAFYAMMERENKDLLTADMEVDEDADERFLDQVVQNIQEEAETKQREQREKTVPIWTLKRLKETQQRALVGHSWNATKKLLSLYKDACHLNDADTLPQFQDPSKPGHEVHNKKRKLAGISPAVRKQLEKRSIIGNLFSFILKSLPVIFDRVNGKVDAIDGKGEHSEAMARRVKNGEKWERVEPLARSFWQNTIHLLIASPDPNTKRFIYSQLGGAIKFLVPFKTLSIKFLKISIKLWGVTEDRNIGVEVFLRVRELVLAFPAHSQFLARALKGFYLALVRQSKFMRPETTGKVSFMRNCVVELYQLDLASSYQHAFVYLRQLAVHLRNTINLKVSQHERQVYNWQFINSLRVWASVLAANGPSKTSTMYPLIYPFVQICLGVLNLSSSITYAPLKAHVFAMLNELTEATRVYVPVASHMLSILERKELLMKPDLRVKELMGDLQVTLYVAAKVSQGKSFQDEMIETISSMLNEHLRIFSFSVAFPEMMIPIRLALNKIKKETNNPKIAKMVQQLKGKLEINADFIKDQRLTIGVTPQQLAEGGLTFEERANEANETNRKVIAPLQKLNDMSSMAQERIERQLKVEAQENEIAAVAKNTKKEKIVKKKKSKPAAVFVQDDNADVDMGEAVDEQEDEVGILELSDSD